MTAYQELLESNVMHPEWNLPLVPAHLNPPEIVLPSVSQFESKVAFIPFHTCWEWTGARMPRGYGVYGYKWKVKNQLAHRVSYMLYKGPIAAGLQIDHLCRNRGCVNPNHLEAVTGKENNRRSNSSSANNSRKTHCKNGHPFNERNTYTSALGSRICRRCQADFQIKLRRKIRDSLPRTP